jgi:predicted dehydrogenase
MSDQLQVGIIGTSWWADMMLLPSLTSHTGAKVVAICGRNRERADEMADKYDVPMECEIATLQLYHAELDLHGHIRWFLPVTI